MKLRKHIKKNKWKNHFKFDFKSIARRLIPKIILLLKLIMVLLFFVLIFYFFLYSSFFQVKTVSVIGANRFVSYEDVKQISTTYSLGKNIFKLNKNELRENLQNLFLGAEDIQIQLNLPDELKIFVMERVPIAIVYKDENVQYLIDAEGYVLGHTLPENADLPKIHYEDEISIGLFIDQKIVPIYKELTTLLTSEDIRVSSMSFHQKHISFSLSDGEQVLIGLEKNKNEAVKALSGLLKQTEIENKKIERIDLRYDKVIVLFK